MNIRYYWTETSSWLVRHKNLLRWVLALLVLILVGKFLANNKESLSRLESLRLWHLAGLYALYVVTLFINAYRTYLIIRSLAQHHISFWVWYKLFIMSRMGNILLSQAGNIYRAAVLKGRYGLSYTTYINFYLFFAWVTTLINFALVFCLILLLRPVLTIAGINGLALMGILIAVILLGPILAEKILKILRPRSGFLAKVFGKLHGMIVTMMHQGTNARLMTKLVALGFMHVTIGVLLLGIVFRGMGVEPNVPDLALFLALYKLSTLIVLTPGNLGIREMAFGFLSQALGIGMAEGILASAMLYAVHSSLVISLGLAFGSSHLFNRKKSGKTERVSNIP